MVHFAQKTPICHLQNSTLSFPSFEVFVTNIRDFLISNLLEFRERNSSNISIWNDSKKTTNYKGVLCCTLQE